MKNSRRTAEKEKGKSKSAKVAKANSGGIPIGNKPKAFKGKASVGQDLYEIVINHDNTDLLGQYQGFEYSMVSIAAKKQLIWVSGRDR